MDVTIKPYQADNDKFLQKRYRDSVPEYIQTVEYYRTGAYNQNGIIEKNIRLMTNDSRSP